MSGGRITKHINTLNITRKRGSRQNWGPRNVRKGLWEEEGCICKSYCFSRGWEVDLSYTKNIRLYNDIVYNLKFSTPGELGEPLFDPGTTTFCV